MFDNDNDNFSFHLEMREEIKNMSKNDLVFTQESQQEATQAKYRISTRQRIKLWLGW